MISPDQSNSAETEPTRVVASDRLGSRFHQLWTKLRGHDAVAIYRVLARFYGQQHRHYHTLAHVEDCLRELDAFLATHPALLTEEMWDAVELALWFHDVVYHARAADNEERSADFFEAVAVEAMFRSHLVASVRRLILATKIDAPSPTAEEQIIADCDLASLGYATDIFKRSSTAIRSEYAFLTDSSFAEARRTSFLRLAERPAIFRTDFMRRRYERQARTNLAAALDSL